MAAKTENIENRLMVLEEKLEYQDYTIDKLNDVIIAQQLQIEEMEERLKEICDRIESMHDLQPGEKKMVLSP